MLRSGPILPFAPVSVVAVSNFAPFLFAVANGVGRTFFKLPKVFGAAKSIKLKLCLTYLLPVLNSKFLRMPKRGEFSLFGSHFFLFFFSQEKYRVRQENDPQEMD